MGFLESLGQGLRIAGGGLSQDVYDQQLRQDELAQKTRQAQLALQREQTDKEDQRIITGIENLSIPKDIGNAALKERGHKFAAGMEYGPNQASLTAKALEAKRIADEAEKQRIEQNQQTLGMVPDFLRTEGGIAPVGAKPIESGFQPTQEDIAAGAAAKPLEQEDLRFRQLSAESQLGTPTEAAAARKAMFTPAEKETDPMMRLFNDRDKLIAQGVSEKDPKIKAIDDRIQKFSKTGQQINVNVPIPGMGMPINTRADLLKIGNKFGMTDAAFEQAVKSFKTAGELPPTMRSVKTLPLQNAIRGAAAMDDPSLIPSVNKAKFEGWKSTYKQNAIRENGVNRASKVVIALEPKVLELSKKINTRLGGQFMNSTMNELSTKFKDDPIVGDIQQLRGMAYTLNREFVVATTMPGSNAQMHTTHAEDAQKLENGDMPINVMIGALKGINTDIQAVSNSITGENRRLEDAMAGKTTGTEDIFLDIVNPDNTGTIKISSKDELQKAIKEGKLKKGDTFNDPDGVPHVVK